MIIIIQENTQVILILSLKIGKIEFIFEVKSVNKSSSSNIDETLYKEKIEKLKEAYIYASEKTGYIFYLPVKINDKWKIWKCENGVVEENINEEMLVESMRGEKQGRLF